jgi:hypothetical protein
MNVKSIVLPATEEVLDMEDLLNELSADLLGYKNNQIFIQNLLRKKAGKWINLNNLCQGLTVIEKQLNDLENQLNSSVLVAWLDYPNLSEYCTIIFFLEDLLWHNIALYKKLNH